MRKNAIAAWANILLTAGGAGVTLFFFFAWRMRSLWQTLGLSMAVAGLLGYAAYLYMRSKPESRQSLLRERKRQAEALCRLEGKKALELGFKALCRRYPLEPVGEGEGLLLARYKDETVAVGLQRELDETNLRDVQAFDRRRGECRAVLLCAGSIRKEARAYAARLRPALTLVELSSLPLQGVAPEEAKARPFSGARALLARMLRRERALVYCQSAALLLGLFILTDRLMYLLPGLLLLFLMALSAASPMEEQELFPAGLSGS